MYDMFDVTKTGAVTAAQANAALATALGGARAAEAVAAAAAAAPTNPLCSKDPASRKLGKEEFVRSVGQVLIQATPNCQLSALGGDDEDDISGKEAAG